MIDLANTLAAAMSDFKSNSPSNALSHNSDIDPELGEVLFEVKVMGNTVKVSALDPNTNTEVCVVGSAYTTPYSLKMNAMRKLRAVIRKNAAKAE